MQLHYERVDIKRLSYDKRNARKHDKKNLKAIKDSLTKFGQQKPLVVDKDYNVIAGNGTLAAAIELGWDTVDVHVSGLSGQEAVAYGIADNRTAELAEWDDDNLKEILTDLNDDGWDLEGLGWDAKDVDNIIGGQGTDGLTDADDVPETAQNEFGVQIGDIWQLGNHRLRCGDSTNRVDVDALMNGEKADMVFTDPPYGYKYESNHQKKHKMLENDDKILDFIPIMADFMESNSCAYVCGSHQTIDAWKPLFSKSLSYKNMIVWKKNNWSMGDLKGAYAGQHELILFGHKGKVELQGKRDTDVWSFDREPPKEHPTQKPVEMIVYAIGKVLCNRVLDLFLGSGSTLIACEKTGRKCYGMELDPHYCSVIIKRWQDFTGLVARKL